MGSINVNIGEEIHFDIVTHSPTTGNKSNADFLPTYKVFEENIDYAMLDGYFSLRSGQTGDYRAMVEASSTNGYGWNGLDGYGYGYGFEEGKFYNIIAEATVGGVTAQSVAMTIHIPLNSGLSSSTIDSITTDILGSLVDGSIDVETALKRILSVVSNDSVITGNDPRVLSFKDSAGTSTIVTHTVDGGGSGRTSAF